MATSSTLSNVSRMDRNSDAQRLAKEKGLVIERVTWEDNSRFPGSCWGSCISDMTLVVNRENMPVIRYPNFTDKTVDIPMDKIILPIGNSQGWPLYQVSLSDFLKNIGKYIPVLEGMKSLYSEDRDQNVIMSAQSCFLPLEDGDVEFNVNIMNYQSRVDDPGILIIVVSDEGVSVATPKGNSLDVYFDKNGKKCNYTATRLSVDRKRREIININKDMTQEEKMQNRLMIIQVPLKQKPIKYQRGGDTQGWASEYEEEDGEMGFSLFERCDVEHAVLKAGKSVGSYDYPATNLERDHRFPCRLTLQYYKATSNGIVNTEVMDGILNQIKEAENWGGLAVCEPSSLVTDKTNRTTKTDTQFEIPSWFDPWFQINYNKMDRESVVNYMTDRWSQYHTWEPGMIQDDLIKHYRPQEGLQMPF